MLTSRDTRFILNHHGLHASWVLSINLMIFSVLPGTQPWYADLLTMLPLMVLSSLVSMMHASRHTAPRSGQVILYWTAALSLSAYFLASIPGFGQHGLFPDRPNISAAATLAAYSFMNAGLEGMWFNRTVLYRCLSNNAIPLNDALRPHEKLVADTWRDSGSLQGTNALYLVTGLGISTISLSTPAGSVYAWVLLAICTGFGIGSLAMVNAIRFEHRLFEMSCYPPATTRHSTMARTVLILLAIALAFILPFRSSLVPPQFFLDLLAMFLGLFSLDPSDDRELSQVLQENYQARNESIPDLVPTPGGQGGVPAVFGQMLLYVFLAGIVLFLVVIPLVKNRGEIIPAIRSFFARMRELVYGFFRSSKAADTKGRKISGPRLSAGAWVREYLEKSHQQRRVPHNRVIRIFSEWLEAWEKHGLTVHRFDTTQALERRVDAILGACAIPEPERLALAAANRFICEGFEKEMFGRTGLDQSEIRDMESKTAAIKAFRPA